MRNRTFFVLLAVLTVGGLAFSQTILGAMFKLGAFTTAALPTSSATTQGALVYDTTSNVVRVNDSAGWRSLAPFVMSGSGGTGAVAINDTSTLGAQSPRSYTTSQSISCVWGGAGAGSSVYVSLVDEIAEKGIVLEVCPGSNVALGIYPTFRKHPIGEFFRRDVKVTISTDDPPFFHTTMAREYDELHRAFDWDEGQFRRLARQALDAAFCDVDTKANIAKLLEP